MDYSTYIAQEVLYVHMAWSKKHGHVELFYTGIVAYSKKSQQETLHYGVALTFDGY